MHFIKHKSFKTKNEPRKLSKVYSKVGHERGLKFEDASYRHSKLVGTNIIIVDRSVRSAVLGHF